MIIDRLRVRGKLNLLLLAPLAAVVLVTVPFVVGQIQNAQSSRTTADAANNARQLGALVWELQRERLVTAAYLADRGGDDVAMVLQQQVVYDSAEALRRSLGSNASEELSNALVRLGSLAELRSSARKRGAPLDSVARAYHAVIEALIDALRLVPQRSSDPEGARQLAALDALLRANEESALRGMALVAAAVNPQIGRELLTGAAAQSQMFTERFGQEADVAQAALVVLVDQGEAARRVDVLAQHIPVQLDSATVQAFVRSVLAAAEAQAGLRRLVQDKVTSQIADAAAARAAVARSTAWSVGVGAALLFALVIGLAFSISRSIANPLQRLTRAAAAVADLTNSELVRVTDVEQVDERPPRLTAIDVVSGDEVGELAVAFNQVQATAALLLERQVVTRRNVSLMFANVAQRTQNLVRRQLALVDELERDEQDTRLLNKLYRLDHLSTRLRRNAENLLVVAGSRSDSTIAAPTPLATVVRSALAEIEDYRRVDLGVLYDVTVAAQLVPDLVLVFAELLENATAFSPPGSNVDVTALPAADGSCQVRIVDRGIGMTARRLAEENRRLVERERLDIAPTSVLGLFVVGRLARRHGLTVELAPTPGNGLTATVTVPASLYTPGSSPVPVESLEMPVATSEGAAGTAPSLILPEIPILPGSFPWFVRELDEPPPPEPEKPPEWPVSASESEQRGTLSRRVRGAQLPVAATRSPDPAPAGPVHDPSAVRDAMDVFQGAFARAASTPIPEGTTPAGPPLSRRTPGASLASELGETFSAAKPRTAMPAPQRDPDAERSAFDGYVAGWAEAERQITPQRP
jgi:signal transduction histidine kinase